MTPELERMIESKDAYRRKLAAKPFSEKLVLMEELSERALATRPDTSATPPEAPWEVPAGWRWVRIGDVAKVVGGGTPRTDRPEFFEGEIPWITPADLSKYTKKTISRGARSISAAGLAASGAQLLPAGTVLFSSRAPIGYVAIAANEVTTNQGFKSFILGPELLPDFVYYYLQAAKELIRSLASGTTFLEISGKKAAQIPVPVPRLDEQRRIVAEIEQQFTRLEAGVTALRQGQAKLKRYRAAVLKAACEGRLVPTEAELARQEGRPYEPASELLARILTERRKNWQGRTKYKEPGVAPEFAQLPEGWKTTNVQQLIVTPLCNGVSVKGSDNPPGIRALRLSAMSNTGFDYAKARYLPLVESDIEDLWIRAGDFFMSRGNGSLHLVGRGTSAQEAPEPTIFPDTMIRLRLVDAVKGSGWLSMLWPSRIIREQIEKQVKTTAGIYKIAQPQVEGILIPLPPLAEQTRIVAEVERRLSVVDELEATVAANLRRAARLRQSILQQAFSGKLQIQ